MSVERKSLIIGTKPDKIALCKELHAKPWPELNAALKAANIRNYSMYLREPENLLLGYWKYVGSNPDADLKALDAPH